MPTKDCKTCERPIPVKAYHHNRPLMYAKLVYCSRACSRRRYVSVRANPQLYGIWKKMRARCSSVSNSRYKDYGGRGIKVVPAWQQFDQFLADMKDSYKPGLTLERVDNNGDYGPSNCTWATPQQQARNTRRNRVITYRDTTMLLCEWADSLHIRSNVITQRIDKYGWSIGRALGFEGGVF